MSDFWEHENNFYWHSPVTRLSKAIAQYEIYKKIINIPGHVIECGVFKGASLIRLLTYREMLESQHSRKVIGFDAFGKFPGRDKFANYWNRTAGEGLSIEQTEAILNKKGFVNYELVGGDIIETVPEYLASHPELKIALLHIDVDVSEPTKVILNTFYSRMVKGGVIVFDDYGTVAGETAAIDEFNSFGIEKLPVSHIPSFTIIK